MGVSAFLFILLNINNAFCHEIVFNGSMYNAEAFFLLAFFWVIDNYRDFFFSTSFVDFHHSLNVILNEDNALISYKMLLLLLGREWVTCSELKVAIFLASIIYSLLFHRWYYRIETTNYCI